MQGVKSDFYISYWTVIKEPLNISIPSTTSNPGLAVGTPVQVGNMNFTRLFFNLDPLKYPTQSHSIWAKDDGALWPFSSSETHFFKFLGWFDERSQNFVNQILWLGKSFFKTRRLISHSEYLVRNPVQAALYSQKRQKGKQNMIILAWQDPETRAFPKPIQN